MPAREANTHPGAQARNAGSPSRPLSFSAHSSFPRSPSFYLFSVVQTHHLWRSTTGILSFSTTVTSCLPSGRRPQEALQDQQEHPPDPDLSVSFPLLGCGRHPPAPGPSAENFLSLQLSTGVPVSSQGPRFLENAAPSQRPPCWPKRITLNPIIPPHSTVGPSRNSTHFVITAGALPRFALVEGRCHWGRGRVCFIPHISPNPAASVRHAGLLACWTAWHPLPGIRMDFPQQWGRSQPHPFRTGPSDCCSPR